MNERKLRALLGRKSNRYLKEALADGTFADGSPEAGAARAILRERGEAHARQSAPALEERADRPATIHRPFQGLMAGIVAPHARPAQPAAKTAPVPKAPPGAVARQASTGTQQTTHNGQAARQG